MKRHKRLADVKAKADGTVEARIATLGVKDRDKDVTLPGFFGTQPVSIVGSHDWSDIMLGKGTVTDENGEFAHFKGKMNLDDPEAAALHSKLMFDMDHPPPLIEWSYGFEILPGGSRKGDHDGEEVQFLGPKEDGTPGAKVWEVSPVMAGAGIDTGTLTAKFSGNTITTNASGITFSDNTFTDAPKAVTDLLRRYAEKWTLAELIDFTKSDVEATTGAVTALVETLAEHPLSESKSAVLTGFQAALKEALEAVSAALQPKGSTDELALLEAQFAAIRQRF